AGDERVVSTRPVRAARETMQRFMTRPAGCVLARLSPATAAKTRRFAKEKLALDAVRSRAEPMPARRVASIRRMSLLAAVTPPWQQGDGKVGSIAPPFRGAVVMVIGDGRGLHRFAIKMPCRVTEQGQYNGEAE